MVETIFHTHAVRRLYKPDLAAFADHLIRLDPDTRYNRYGLQVSDDYLKSYAELCFKSGSLVYGYFEDGLIRGAAELRVFASKEQPLQKAAEGAFSVEIPWRRRGIGTELMGHVVLAARNRSVTKKFEADLEFEHNDVTGHLVARPPSALSYFREFVDNSLDFVAAFLDYQGRLLKATTTAR